MDYIISERQYNIIKEETILTIPSMEYFNNDWNLLQKFLERRGNPPYKIHGNLSLPRSQYLKITSLGNLISVKGDLFLYESKIESLGSLALVGGDLDLALSKIKSLGDLISVGGHLTLGHTNIESLGDLISVGGDLILSKTNIESFGGLAFVGGNLILTKTKLRKKYSVDEIREMVDVKGVIYL